MTDPKSARPLALVTGASSGMGKIFAERLASQGTDLILVARRRDRLEALADQLRRDGGARCEVIGADLTDGAALDALAARLAGGESLDLLINNAGFGGFYPFATIDARAIDELIDINIRAVTRLTRAVLPDMIRRGAGGIINIGSVLALSGTLPPNPLPYRATYAAAKAFVLTFTQALAGELAGTGVRAMVCLPGPTSTEFFAIQGFDVSKYPAMMTPDDVVTAALAGLAAGEVTCVPALADATMLDRLAGMQQSVLASIRQSSELAERYRPHAVKV
jgi:short-subunit dehydrogenase